MVCAAAARSPVIMPMRATPAARSVRIARGVSARNSSASRSAPAGRSSTARKTTNAERHAARRVARIAHASAGRRPKTMS